MRVGGACHVLVPHSSQSTWKSFKITAYQNNNSEDTTDSLQTFSLQPSKYHQSLPTEFYNLTVFYQDLPNGQFYSEFHFASQPGHWGSLSGSDLVVDLAEPLLIPWIVLVDTGESLLYSSPPIASEMTHFQRVKRFLCAKTLKRFCPLTPHILDEFNLNALKIPQFCDVLSVVRLAVSLPRW